MERPVYESEIHTFVNSFPDEGYRLTHPAWWILGIALTVAVAWMTIKHDQIVEVCSRISDLKNSR